MVLESFKEYAPLFIIGHLANGDGTNYVAFPSGSSSNWRWDKLVLSNSDTIAHNVNLRYNAGGIFAYLGTVAVPAGAGQTTVAAVDLLAALVTAYQQGIPVKSGDQLAWRVEETINAPNFVAVHGWGGSY